MNGFCSFFGGGPAEEEERIVKGDDVIVELDATLEDLYMGGSLKVKGLSWFRIYYFYLLPYEKLLFIIVDCVLILLLRSTVSKNKPAYS